MQDPMARRYMSKRYAEVMGEKKSTEKPECRPSASSAPKNFKNSSKALPGVATIPAPKFPKAEPGTE